MAKRAPRVLVRMTAAWGDGTENWYRGPNSIRLHQIIRDLLEYDWENGSAHDMIEVDPIDYDTGLPCEPDPKEICECTSTRQLLRYMVLWMNCGNRPLEYEPRRRSDV